MQREWKIAGTIYPTEKKSFMSNKYASLYLIPLYTFCLYYKCKSVFNIRQNLCFSKDFSLHRDWATFSNQGGFVFNLLCCLKSWKLPWCRVIYALCMELWLHTKCLRWRIDQSWWGEESTGEQAESRWWYSIQFKCILLVLSICTSCLVKQGDNLFSPRGLKSTYTVSLTLNTKWIPRALNPQWKILSVFQDSDNGDCSSAHEFKECCLCMLTFLWHLMKAVKATNLFQYLILTGSKNFSLQFSLSFNRIAAMSVAKGITKVPNARRYQVLLLYF